MSSATERCLRGVDRRADQTAVRAEQPPGRQEVELAKAELAVKGKRAGIGAGMFGGAGVFGFYGLGRADRRRGRSRSPPR